MAPADSSRPDRRRFLLTAASAAGGTFFPACRRAEQTGKTTEPEAPPEEKTPEWLLTPGAPPPDWSKLDAWQGAVTREEFERLLALVTDGTSWYRHVEIRPEAALIRISTPDASKPRYELKFAGTPRPTETAVATAAPRYWRRLEELPPLTSPDRPLDGVHVALDPGHIGGVWAQMEERWYQSADAPPVKEGDLNLRTARVLAPLLENLGAKVSFVRSTPAPLTATRPETLLAEAQASLEQEGGTVNEAAIRREAERLFYRVAEIRARGQLVNGALKPDLVLCLHYNADGWGNPGNATFSPNNHLHILAHGCIGSGEFELDDQRLEGLLRLVQRVPDTEMPLCAAVARRMVEATGLPAFRYAGGNARMVEGEPYVWRRNLLANRIYQCPVVYPEPYVMNNREVFERIRAGDYEGMANIAGRERLSIFQEYARGVTEGLRDFFSQRPGA